MAMTPGPVTTRTTFRSGQVFVIAVAAAIILLHLLTNSRYGFHRDELQFFADARHLDWGYVVYPPVTPLLGRISLSLFGVSLLWLRLLPVLGQAAVILLTGAMTRELGGNRLAQFTAALAVALSAVSLHYGTQFMYSSFDYLWWVLAAYFVILLLKSQNPMWWLPIGATLGIGLMTKYTILCFACGIIGGFLLTQSRSLLRSKWFWIGAGLAIVMVLPNLLWQIKYNFISAHALHWIHIRDLGWGRGDGFLLRQPFKCINLFATPIVIAGLVTSLRNPAFKRYRPLAWMYLIPLALLMLARAREYYIAPAYPMLIALGAGTLERWLPTLTRPWRIGVQSVLFTGIVLIGIFGCCIVLPIASSGPLYTFAISQNSDLHDEFGWDDMLRTVSNVRDSLPEASVATRSQFPPTAQNPRPDVGILVGNYGLTGAIEILGPPYHLPPPISAANSAWVRGYPQPTPSTLILVGIPREEAETRFNHCYLAARLDNRNGRNNDESLLRPDVFVCGPPRKPWPEFWKDFKRFQ